MAGKLAQEIKQKGFSSIEQEAVLNILRTAQMLDLRTGEFLRDYGLTVTQYNVLRILRGAGSSGLACSQIAERMIAHDPDITRLLDRMESSSWVVRARSCTDRRVVVAKITQDALVLLEKVDSPLSDRMKQTFGKLKQVRLHELIGTLEEVRENIF